ncbi:MAG: apolipoprotein N-acyltransferase [Acidimicrobiales bacterium]
MRRAARRALPILLPLAGGALVGLSLPPIGWWPMGIAGVAVLAWSLSNRRPRGRLWIGLVWGIGQFSVSLAWAFQFNIAGYVVLSIVEAGFVAVACLLVPPGRGRLPALAVALTLAEWGRQSWPFGGLPLGGIALGQVSGPLGPSARLGGTLLVAGLTYLAGACLGACLPSAGRAVEGGRDASWTWRAGLRGTSKQPAGLSARLGALLASLVVVVVAGAGFLAANGGAAGTARHLKVALVQGGGPRGLDQLEVSPSRALAAALKESAQISPGRQLVLWPEDVVALEAPLAGSHAEAELEALAEQDKATLIAGVTYPVGASLFRNEIAAFSPTGHLVAVFEKVHRVPFGEYVPFRGFFRHFANLSDIPRDAIPGTGSGMIATPAGRLAALISFEVFFGDRGRSGVRAGGQLILVPTNTSSYSDAQAPSQEIAASRLQALEEGRYVLQASPTGYSAVITNTGHVEAATQLSAAAVIDATVPLLSGDTVYERFGDDPVLVAAGIGLAAAWGVWFNPPLTRRRRRRRQSAVSAKLRAEPQ